MSILTIVLGEAGSASGTRGPRFGYDNAGVGATVTATSTDDGYDPANLFDWKPYTYWKPATSGVHHVTVIPASTPTVDYFAVAQQNLGENGGTIKLQYSLNSGGSWLDATDAIAPVANESLWRTFEAITASHWRLEVTSTPASVIGVVSFGTAYQPEFGVLPGFAPPQLARAADVYATTSDAGLFLGRSILSLNLETEINFRNMAAEDCYTEWLPFMKHAERKPFFLAWLIEDFPTDIALMESDGKIPAPTFTTHGRMSCGLRMKGLCPS